MYIYRWTAHFCWPHLWKSHLPNRSTYLLVTWLATNWPNHFLPIPRGVTRQTTGASLPSKHLGKTPTKETYIPADRNEACRNPPPAPRRPPREWRTGERHVSRPPLERGRAWANDTFLGVVQLPVVIELVCVYFCACCWIWCVGCVVVKGRRLGEIVLYLAMHARLWQRERETENREKCEEERG